MRASAPDPVLIAARALAGVADGIDRGAAPELRWLDGYLERHREADPGDGLDPIGDGLTEAERTAAALAMAVEIDPYVGRVVARLQAPVPGTRPSLGLVGSLTGADPVAIAAGRAVACELLVVGASGQPLPDRPISVPLPIVGAARGAQPRWPGAQIGPEAHTPPLPPSMTATVARHAAGLEGARRALLIRSASSTDGRALAAAVAAALDRVPVVFPAGQPAPGRAPWLMLVGGLPVFEARPGPNDVERLAALPGYDGPIIVVTGPDDRVELADRAPVTWHVSPPDAAERIELWRAAVTDGALAEHLGRMLRIGPGRIAELGRLAYQRAATRGLDAPALDDLVAACWDGEAARLDGLATPVTERIPDDALLLEPRVREGLDRLLIRCRRREDLSGALGVAARIRYRPGVRALLVGPSGTGKTLAAAWLASHLTRPLFRVDLASVLSKYIGETEKNLSALLARAEHADVVLLFDEADSLFGQRTDVRHATDRFANAQTNYLLQRIEDYDGVVILTSNSRSRFDGAFTRRLDAIIEFGAPDVATRRALWLAHLGDGHCLPAARLNRLAACAALTGGHIRGAAFTAAVLADGAPIGWSHVMRALDDVYRKLGQPRPSGLGPTP